MAKLVWKDETSYSQNDTVREPRTWSLTTCTGLRLTVTRLLHLEGWWLDCHDLGIKYQETLPKDITAEQAQNLAIKTVRNALCAHLNSLPPKKGFVDHQPQLQKPA